MFLRRGLLHYSHLLIVSVFLLIPAKSKAQTSRELLDSPEKYRAYQEKVFKLIFSNPPLAKKKLDELINDKGNIEDSLMAANYNELGVYFGVLNINDSSLFYFNKALLLTPENSSYKIGVYTNMAIVKKNMVNYADALDYLYSAEKIAVQHNDKIQLAGVYGELASCHNYMENYPVAMKYIVKSLNILENSKGVPEIDLNNEKQKLANIYAKTGDFKKAAKIFKEILPSMKANGDLDNYYVTEASYVDCLLDEKKFSEAENLLNDAYSGLKKIGNKEHILFGEFALINFFSVTKKYSELVKQAEISFPKAIQEKSRWSIPIAVKYIQGILQLGNTDNIRQVEQKVYQAGVLKLASLTEKSAYFSLLSQYYEQKGNSSKSLQFLKQSIRFNDEFRRQYDLAVLKETEAAYERKLTQKENIILEQKLHIRNRIYSFVIVIIILVLLIILYLWNNQRMRNKINELALENSNREKSLLKENLEYEQSLNNVKEELIDKQKNELIASTLEKAQLSDRIRQIIAKMEKEGANPGALNQLEKLRNQDKYWDVMVKKFNTLNPQFEKNMKLKYPALTKSDIEFCVMIKLNMSYKEIASILQISHDSVITKKYRITKKMKIDSDTDFYHFVQNVD